MVLKRLFKSPAQRRQAVQEGAIADPIIDRLVQATDRRLAQVPRYREALRSPVLAARERVAAMIAVIPGPFEVSPASWSDLPGLKPLFVKAEEAAAAWSGDERVQAFFDRGSAPECIGMLALLQAEKRVLTMVSQESMQVEVARTTVSFREPQVIGTGPDEAAVREELTMRALEYLALRAMERVGEVRAQKRSLEKERALLQAQLQLAQRRGSGLGAIASGQTPAGADPKAIERDLARAVENLEQIASTDLLPMLLEELLAALARPEEHLTIEPCALVLDPMNFAVPPSPQAVTPCVATLKLARRGPFAVLVARFPRAALRPPVNRLAEAARYL